MTVSSQINPELVPVAARTSAARMPAHWLMARLGKRVLRPGGLETTRWLLDQLAIGPNDDVIEFAPGLAATAVSILGHRPRSYLGVERDAEAAARAESLLGHFPAARILCADARRVPRPDGAATCVLGEALLSMQADTTKRKIVAEAHRLLAPGGRYAIHELAVHPCDVDRARLTTIERELSAGIHVAVRIGTVTDWLALLETAGFVVERVTTAPMRLSRSSDWCRMRELGRLLASFSTRCARRVRYGACCAFAPCFADMRRTCVRLPSLLAG